ncbi:MAG: YbbR-like domain-containing protein, partial [Acutalibacteraceae bacterium]
MSVLNSFSLKKLMLSKRFMASFSILTAFALWLGITISLKPSMTRTFSDMTVTINMENTFAAENQMNIINDISEQRFTVVVRGPNSVVSVLSPSDINLYASAAAVDAPGEYKLVVAAANSTANSNYEILSITPSTISVSFDYMETREFTIMPLAEGATAVEGLIAESAVVSGTESNTITIKGPRSVVNNIEKVEAKAVVNQALKSSSTFDADIVLYNEKGDTIDPKNLTLSTNKVKVTVPISKKKTVP